MAESSNTIINTFEKLANIRHKLEITLIEQVQQNTNEKFFLSEAINSGIDLMKIAVERRYSFEKDFFGQIRGKSDSHTETKTDPKSSDESKSDVTEIIQIITILEEQTVTVPLSVQNYDTDSQDFTLEGGDIIELDEGQKINEKLSFDPISMQIGGNEKQEFKLKIIITPEKFETNKRYISSFNIKSKYEKRMNVLINIIPKETLSDKAYPIIRMLEG